jgi:hypothetical protein
MTSGEPVQAGQEFWLGWNSRSILEHWRKESHAEGAASISGEYSFYVLQVSI